MKIRRSWIAAAAASVAVLVGSALVPLSGRETSGEFAPPRPEPKWPIDAAHAEAFLDLALQRASVRTPTDPAAFDFAANSADPSGTLSEPIVRCRFLPKAAHGTTPKFDCVLRDGEVVKVKYGRYTGEIHAEIAASRLLTALGFGADRMYMVPKVRCYGCPWRPFDAMWALDLVHARELVTRYTADSRYTDFEWVRVEREFAGLEIEAGDREGWAWHELDRIDPAKGASRVDVDALRLMAMFLSHWDNKASNQRLVCLAAPSEATSPCPRSFALIHDLGATFGPNKLDLESWKATPIWADRAQCRVSMKQFPYEGGTFPDAQISEAGRQLAARLLNAISERQIAALFSAARFPEFFGGRRPDADVSAWVQTFRDKVNQIASGNECPAEVASSK